MDLSLLKVKYTKSEDQHQAKTIAKNLQLQCMQDDGANEMSLVYSNDRLGLRVPGFKKEFVVDFLSEQIKYRIKSLSKESILKACGIKNKVTPSVLDITGGWGLDSYLIATAGCQVIVLEQSPIIHALLEDGIKRVCEYKDINIQSINIDSNIYLMKIEQDKLPDVIYCDPMREQSKNMPKNKKEIEIIRQIVGTDLPVKKLILLAIEKAKSKVIVKSATSDLININLKCSLKNHYK